MTYRSKGDIPAIPASEGHAPTLFIAANTVKPSRVAPVLWCMSHQRDMNDLSCIRLPEAELFTGANLYHKKNVHLFRLRVEDAERHLNLFLSFDNSGFLSIEDGDGVHRIHPVPLALATKYKNIHKRFSVFLSVSSEKNRKNLLGLNISSENEPGRPSSRVKLMNNHLDVGDMIDKHKEALDRIIADMKELARLLDSSTAKYDHRSAPRSILPDGSRNHWPASVPYGVYDKDARIRVRENVLALARYYKARKHPDSDAILTVSPHHLREGVYDAILSAGTGQYSLSTLCEDDGVSLGQILEADVNQLCSYSYFARGLPEVASIKRVVHAQFYHALSHEVVRNATGHEMLDISARIKAAQTTSYRF